MRPARPLLILLLLVAVACGPREATDRGSASTSGDVSFAPTCVVVGEWHHEHHLYPSDIAMCVEPDGTRRLRQAFADGSVYQAVLTPVAGGAGERFLRDPGTPDYYEVLPDGRLEIGDDHGVIVYVFPSP